MGFINKIEGYNYTKDYQTKIMLNANSYILVEQLNIYYLLFFLNLDQRSPGAFTRRVHCVHILIFIF